MHRAIWSGFGQSSVNANMSLNESIVEDAALTWFRRRQGYAGQVGDQPSPRLRQTRLGYAVGHGAPFAALRRAKPPLAPGEPAAERDSFSEVVQSRFARTLTRPLPAGEEKREAIRRLNPANACGNPHPTSATGRGGAGNW
jgi:hypothetical protein